MLVRRKKRVSIKKDIPLRYFRVEKVIIDKVVIITTPIIAIEDFPD